MIETHNIVVVPYSSIKPSSWSATYTFRPEFKLLAQSLRDLGWVQPIIVRDGDSTIIDGFARWVIAQSDKLIVKRDEGLVPTIRLSCDEVDAMIHHVRLNRARGMVLASPLSKLITASLSSGKYGRETLRQSLGMTTEEFDLLREPDLLISKKVKEHTYSRAWVPIEAPPVGTVISAREINPVSPNITIERPPNADR